MRTLADLTADGVRNLELVFLDEPLEIQAEALYDEGAERISRLVDRSDSQAIAALLSNSSDSVATILGSIACGARLVSLPPPARATDPASYKHLLEYACRQAGASTLVVDDQYASMLETLELADIRVVANSSIQRLQARVPSAAQYHDGFELVQHTSGSTNDPKGIVLSEGRIVANVDAILSIIAPERGDATCSWLPLSHDMGLIGMLMCAVVGAGEQYAGRGRCIMLQPESFLRSPSRWLDAISHYRATITAAPDFGYRLTFRHAQCRDLDLSRLRICIVGGEPIRASTLNNFEAAFAQCRFAGLAFSPAYGMAEAVLAVTLTPPEEHWQVDSISLSERYVDTDWTEESVEIVSSGRPLPGFTVESGGSLGELLIDGPPIADRYTDGEVLRTSAGLYPSGDLGVKVRDSVFVVGRVDDIIMVAGRKIVATTIENAAGTIPGVRPGRNAAGTIPGVRPGRVVVASLPSGQWLRLRARVSRNGSHPYSS